MEIGIKRFLAHGHRISRGLLSHFSHSFRLVSGPASSTV